MRVAATFYRSFYALLLVACLTFPAHAEVDLRYEIKAAYLYQIFNYVHWDESKLSNTICVISPTDIKNYFLSIDGKLFREQTVQIKSYTNVVDVNDQCNLLFFAPGSEKELSTWSENAQQNVVTIADNRLSNGELSMIQLLRRGTKLKFVAHNYIAKKHGVSFSSRLLRVAYYVD